jgi:hypothetical protein
MGLVDLERGLEFFSFAKKLKQTITQHPLPCVFSFASGTQKNICNPLVCTSNDTKIAQFASEMRKILKSVQVQVHFR